MSDIFVSVLELHNEAKRIIYIHCMRPYIFINFDRVDFKEYSGNRKITKKFERIH